MGPDLFKAAVENARGVHRSLLLASLILGTFLLPGILDSPTSLQKALNKIGAIRSHFTQNFADFDLTAVEKFVVGASPQRESGVAFLGHSWLDSNTFEYDAGNGRSVFATFTPIRLNNPLDFDFSYSDTQLKIIKMSIAGGTSAEKTNFVNTLINRREKFSNFSNAAIPTLGKFGTLRPRWFENIAGIFPTRLTNLSDAIRLWYVAQKLEGIIYFLPKFEGAKISIVDFDTSKTLALSQFSDFDDLPEQFPLRCSLSLDNQKTCAFHFANATSLERSGDVQLGYTIRGVIETKKYRAELSLPCDALALSFTPAETCVKISGSDCDSDSFSSVLDFFDNYGEIPLDNLTLISKFIQDRMQSINILGITITGVTYVGLFGSIIIVTLLIVLSVNISWIAQQSLHHELTSYAEIVPVTKIGVLLAVLSVTLVPNIAISENLAITWHQQNAVTIMASLSLFLGILFSIYLSFSIAKCQKNLSLRHQSVAPQTSETR